MPRGINVCFNVKGAYHGDACQDTVWSQQVVPAAVKCENSKGIYKYLNK